jgi:hypothetical protein
MKTKLFSLLTLALSTVSFADVHPDHNHEHHQGIELLGTGIRIPELKIELVADAMSTSSVNLKLKTESFRFAPEHVNQAHQTIDQEFGYIVEGHAHLYVNGVKQTRLYGNHFFLQNVKEGDLVRVELNSNDHRIFLVYDSQAASAEAVVPALGNPHEHH